MWLVANWDSAAASIGSGRIALTMTRRLCCTKNHDAQAWKMTLLSAPGKHTPWVAASVVRKEGERILSRKNGVGSNYGGENRRIHEAYYKNRGKIRACRERTCYSQEERGKKLYKIE